MVTFANLGSVRLPSLKFVGLLRSEDTAHLVCQLSIYNSFPVIRTTIAKKSSFLRTPAFIFCLPWGRPCGNHAQRCMNEKTIQCLSNLSQHVPIYLQQFPSYSNRKCKKSRFHVPQPTFLFLLEPPSQPATITQYVAWMERQLFSVCQTLAACSYLYSIVSELYNA